MKSKTFRKFAATLPNDAHSARCPSGIEGLDDILAGGLPQKCFYLIQGDPGSGKTTLALQFLLEGLRRGERVFYITLSETKEELLQVARSHGWSLDDIPLLELSAIEALLRPEAQTTVFHPSEIELKKVTNLLLEETRKVNPARVVFDSLSEFRLIAETPLRYRRHLLNLKQQFAKYGSTVLLLDDKMNQSGIGIDPHVLSLTHGVIEMEQLSPDYGTSRRRLRVTKMRGVKFREGYHDYIIITGGLRIFPRLVAAEHRLNFKRQSVSSGVKEFDRLLGGGLDRGTTNLLLGPAGSGKSTIAIQYAVQMAGKKEPSKIFAFDENLPIMIARAEALGLPLKKLLKDKLVNARQIDPAEISPGEFASLVRSGVDEGCKLIVIDSLNGYLNAMPGEKYLTNQLHELSAYLNQQGVVTILVMAQHGMVTALESPLDLSYLCDTVINLRYFESAGEVKQSLAVVKKRSGDHERTIREFRLESGKGIRIGKPLRDFHGILTGAPVFDGAAEKIMQSS
ncbi:MAG TPA: ATPase domain-containing protein [Pyrinomonadaceae bacterium]|nr:ATPase domain-containing protein [Pyrinomonadaceae bacterium]